MFAPTLVAMQGGVSILAAATARLRDPIANFTQTRIIIIVSTQYAT